MKKIKFVQIGLIITTMMIYLGAHLLHALSYYMTEKILFAGLIETYVITIVDFLLLSGFILSFVVIILILSEK